jgi:hypothetical protein
MLVPPPTSVNNEPLAENDSAVTEEFCKVTSEVETAVNELAEVLPSLPVTTTSPNVTVEPEGCKRWVYICKHYQCICHVKNRNK